MPDPYRGFNFKVEIDGISEAGFQECSGLDATTDPVEYREGTDPNHVRQLTGLNKYAPITLKRGITDSDKLWQWRQKVIDGKTERKNVSVVLYNEAQEEKLRWNLRKAWPSKWTGPTFNSTSNEVAIETLEIVHEEVVKG
ncbi:MAG: phage tail protein [Iphinoe sp. HA4291-MV1]|jgi:phage tail-like protein|nr:phage tail protein [Iphinoe sp. HA4291-MV1]